MHWESIDQFLSMGGYGFYVWTSFGFTFALLIMELCMLKKEKSSKQP